MSVVRKAVFPVAGLGTRFLPATKANPKEMLPIVDKPLIQYAVEEAADAGITEMIFITSSAKRAIADHFDKNNEMESELEKKKKYDLLAQLRDIVPKGVSCVYIRQPEALGLGHAVLCAKPVVGNDLLWCPNGVSPRPGGRLMVAAGNHCFVVPAYGRSPYLEECLASLAAQMQRSNLVVTTSTPFDRLDAITARYGAQLVIHGSRDGIGRDWNAALEHAVGDWVTIAHQDDIYAPNFSTAVLDAATRYPDALLVFTGYQELLAGVRRSGGLLAIKKALLEFGFLGRERARSRMARTNALRFGNAIPCPAVTVHRARTGLRFDESMRTNMDWAAWLDLCELDGSFVYLRAPLMAHRIHPDSETSSTIDSGHRAAEDLELLRRLWPNWIARAITRAYALAYASNAAAGSSR